jgi:hypothetical protein
MNPGVVLDSAAAARRLAGDLGAGILVFVVADDEPMLGDGRGPGEIDVNEAERRLSASGGGRSELRAASGFLRAGGELVVLTTAQRLAGSLDTVSSPGNPGTRDGGGMLHIRHTLPRARSEAPVLAAGWC